MIITLELIVFAFGASVTVFTAVTKLLNRISELHTLLVLLRGEVEHIKHEQERQALEQARQSMEIQDVHFELRAERSARPAYRSGDPQSQGSTNPTNSRGDD